uniref:Uncharacterized protein n=1 Tax=mine drainage metagenome TaxID=410659 RepID=E6PYX4_9ZZZZ
MPIINEVEYLHECAVKPLSCSASELFYARNEYAGNRADYGANTSALLGSRKFPIGGVVPAGYESVCFGWNCTESLYERVYAVFRGTASEPSTSLDDGQYGWYFFERGDHARAIK